MSIPLPSNRPVRILVTRTDRIGDLVLTTPVFSALRKRFPDAWISALVFRQHRELVEGNPAINEVLLYDKSGTEKNWIGNFLFAQKLAKIKFDLVIHMHATNRMHLLTWLAKIPIRIGYDRRLPWALTHVFKYEKKQGEKHEAAYNFDLLKPLGIVVPEKFQLHFPLSRESKEALQELLVRGKIDLYKPIVVINPSASCPSKIWPASYFSKLCEKIAKSFDVNFILIGSTGDQSIVHDVMTKTHTKIYDWSGKLSLGVLGALLRAAVLLISNDSGPVHIATAVDTPVISIFGRNQPGLSPTRWKPLGIHDAYLWKDVGCTRCLAHLCQINFLCLESILVQDVYDVVLRYKDLLTRKKSPHETLA